MSNTFYDLGDQVRMSVSFTNSAGSAADPTTVTCKITDPSGNIETLVYGTDPDLVKAGTGSYQVDRKVDESGMWYYRFEGTGSVVSAAEGFLVVRRSRVS